MHATQHLHQRRALLAALAALALALAVAAVLAAAIENGGFSLGTSDRGTPAAAPVVAVPATQDEPAWEANPFAYPLLQVPSE